MPGIRTTAGRLRESVRASRPVHRFVYGTCADCGAIGATIDPKSLQAIRCIGNPSQGS